MKKRKEQGGFVYHLFIYTTTFYVRLQHHIEFEIKFIEL